MKGELVKTLACPVCKGDLTLTITEEKAGEIITGKLSCFTCQKGYPINEGIPNLLTQTAACPQQA